MLFLTYTSASPPRGRQLCSSSLPQHRQLPVQTQRHDSAIYTSTACKHGPLATYPFSTGRFLPSTNTIRGRYSLRSVSE